MDTYNIVTEMGSSNRHTFSILEASHIIPIDLLVTKGRPSVLLRLEQEFVQGATDWRGKQELSRDRVIKLDGQLFLALFNGLEKVGGRPVPSKLGIVSIKVANPVGSVVIAVPSQVLLHRLVTRAVCLFAHDRFIRHNR